MSLVIVHLPGVSQERVVNDVSSRGVALSNPTIQVVSPDPTPLLKIPEPSLLDESGEASYAAGDPARQSMLFGRYVGQIDARVQRAWRRPRSRVNVMHVINTDDNATAHHAFRCQAQISQDSKGNVTEIELTRCNGSPEWQLSLIRAIHSASPLPAPPDPTVFTNVLAIAFEAKEYVPGYRDDEYE